MEQVEAPPSSRRKIPKWLVPVVGYALSLGCLVWVLRSFPLQQFWHDIQTLEWKWVALAVIVELALPLVQGWRWWILLSAAENVSFWRCSQAIYVGMVANDILPARAGEVIRCYLLSHWEDMPISLAITGAAIERLMDGMWIVIMFFIVAADIPVPHWLSRGVLVLGLGVMSASAVLLFILFRRTHAHTMALRRPWLAKFAHVLEELHALGDWRAIGLTMLASLVFFLLQVVPIWALFRAGGFDLSLRLCALVMIVIRLGTMIPNAPGNIGVFQLACENAMQMLGVEHRNAQTFSQLQLALSLVPLLGGVVAVAITGMNINEIHHHAHHAHARRRPEPPRKNFGPEVDV